jgi:hypothetical protein
MPPKRKYLSKEFNDIATKPNRSYRRLMPYPPPPTTSEVPLTDHPPFTFVPAAAPSRKDSFDYNNFDFNSLNFNSLDFNSLDFNCLDFDNPDFNSSTFNNLDWNCPLWNDMTPPMPSATLSSDTAQQSQDAPRKRSRLYVPGRSVYGSVDLSERSGKIPTPPPNICDDKPDISYQQANKSLACSEQGLEAPSLRALGRSYQHYLRSRCLGT